MSIAFMAKSNVFINASLDLNNGKNWLLEVARALEYRGSDGGLCFGVAHMAMQAFLSGEMDVYTRRLALIFDNLDNDIPAQIKVIQNKLKEQKNITETEREFLDILAFFEGVDAYLNSYYYVEEYPTLFLNSTKLPSQDAKTGFSIVHPVSLEKHELYESPAFSGKYNALTLKTYFELFSRFLNKVETPISFIVQTDNHAIMLGYHQGKWTFLDPTKPTRNPQETTDPDRMADWLLKALSGKQYSPDAAVSFSARIYSENAKTDTHINKMLTEISNDEQWKSIHVINENAAKPDIRGRYWLNMAACGGDTSNVQKLVGVTEKFPHLSESIFSAIKQKKCCYAASTIITQRY